MDEWKLYYAANYVRVGNVRETSELVGDICCFRVATDQIDSQSEPKINIHTMGLLIIP